MKNNFSEKEVAIQGRFFQLIEDCPMPDNEMLSNLGLLINRHDLTRILFTDNLYKKVLDVHGVVVKFGVRWGQDLALFEYCRGLYETFNHNWNFLVLILLRVFLQYMRKMEIAISFPKKRMDGAIKLALGS